LNGRFEENIQSKEIVIWGSFYIRNEAFVQCHSPELLEMSFVPVQKSEMSLLQIA